MLTFTKDYQDHFPCPMEAFGSHSGYLFFDIETTGLSARTSHLYLIGCLYTDGHAFHLSQWFAESPSEEKEVLQTFSSYLDRQPEDCLLLQFNGNGFDVPYLRQRYERYRMAFPLDRFENLDLYRVIRPYKNVLGLPSLKQKALEDYLHIKRTDPFNGGELIPVYEDYADTRSPQGLQALLLHNLEDVQNMPKLLAILQIRNYMEASYQLRKLQCHHTAAFDGTPKEELLVTLQSPYALPNQISLRLENGLYLTAKADLIHVSIPLLSMTLKYFFPDAKDYFYLPEEDRAVHKCVGIYVDPEHRVKATKDTCYVKKTSVFLPCPAGLEPPKAREVYRSERKDKTYYLEWKEESLSDLEDTQTFWSSYIHCIWKSRR